MSKRQLIINIIANLISFLATLLISFFLTPFLIRNIGKEAYGFYPIANNFVGYLMIISLALNSMAARYITIEIVKNKIKKAQEYFSSVFFSNIILSLILFIPMLFIVLKIDVFLTVPIENVVEIKILFALIFLSMLITIFSSVFGVASFSKNRLDYKSYSEIIQGIVRITLYLLLFYIFRPSLIFIGVVAVLLSITNLIMQIIITKILLPDFTLKVSYFNFSIVKELLSSGVWNSLNSLGSQLLLGMTLIITNIFLGAITSAEIAIVQTLPHLISSIIIMLFSIFMPRITSVYAAHDKNELVSEVVFSQKVVGLISTIPILLLIIFGDEFYRLWLPGQDTEKLQLFSVLTLIPLIIHANMWTIYGLNIAMNKVKIPSLVLILTGILSFISTLIAMNLYKKDAIIILILSSFFNILYYLVFIPLYSSNVLRIKWKIFYKHIIRIIVFSLIFVFVGLITKNLLVINNWLSFIIWGGIYGLIGLVLNFILITNKNDWEKIKKLFDSFFTNKTKINKL